MGSDLPHGQGLFVRSGKPPVYDETAKTLTRFTEVGGVQITSTGEEPIADIGSMVDGLGLMFGLNLKARGHGHVLRKVGGKEALKFAFGVIGHWPTSMVEITENSSVTTFLDDAFDMEGRWIGFSIPRGHGYAGQSLYIQLDVTQIKLKHLKSAHFVPLVASLGEPTSGNVFLTHFVAGLSVFTAPRGPSRSEEFRSTVIAIPS